MLKIYNTLTREVEEFKPLGKTVKMFVCGPTVYDYSHLGHARTYIVFDVIAKWLRHIGYEVYYLMNITDVDDKIIKKAEEMGTGPIDLARRFESYFIEDIKALGIDTIDKFARASDHIPEILDFIRRLIEKGFAYETRTGVYFDISKFGEYGKLSHQEPEELNKHRIEPDPTKRNPVDFSLWRKTGGLTWDSTYGRGRPGWHIEDTAIAEKYLGQQYDIHGGAIDLIFPHHESEIAQMEALSGKPMVKCWIHTGFLTVNGKKMSKSLGNFITIRDILKKYDANLIRLFMLSVHYRSPIDFDESLLEGVRNKVKKLQNLVDNIQTALKNENLSEIFDKEFEFEVERLEKKFSEYMNDDFNTPMAINVVFDLAKEINKYLENPISRRSLEKAYETFSRLTGILGLKFEPTSEDLPEEVVQLIKIRDVLRKEGKFEIADEMRKRLMEKGFVIEDTPSGTKCKRIA
jgi:cysteinyl-tRNA synthetase